MINHWATALWQSITVSIEGTNASFVACSDYGYKAWIEDVFSYSEESAKQQLVASGYLADKPGELDSPDVGSNKLRSKWLTAGNGDHGFLGFNTTVGTLAWFFGLLYANPLRAH